MLSRVISRPPWQSITCRRLYSASSRAGKLTTRANQVWIIGATAGAAGIASLLATKRPAYAETVVRNEIQKSTLPIGMTPVPKHDISELNMNAAKLEFIEIVGKNGINEAPGDLKSRSSTDWSPSPTSRTASFILFPKDTAQVSEIMKVCHKRNIPVTPFSGGTSLDGALAATRGGICLDFSRMNKIIALHKEDIDVVVGPGVGWEELNEQLSGEGFFFPPDPGPGAQIGGMIGTGCSGTNAYRYGPMKDWVIGVVVVLADGTIVKTRRRPRKSTAGYDLTRLIVGSSGTLGIVTEATLKLAPLPQNEQVAVIAFESTHGAVSTVIEMLQGGIQVEAIELMDATSMKAANDSGYTETEYKECPTLFMKFAGREADVVQRQIKAVQDLSKAHKSVSFDASSDPETIEGLWGARKTSLWNLLAQKENPDDELLSCDVAVPISQLANIVTETTAMFEKAGLHGSTLGHVGDGNFHATVMYSQAQKEVAEKLILEVRRRGIELEGTVTGEHGVGLALRDLVTEELGTDATDLMRKIKLSLDPKCLLDCDKVVRIDVDI